MPRQSQASLSIAHLSPHSRLVCPPDLGGVEAEIFRATVAAAPANHFAAEDLPLCAYCRAIALERRSAEELQAGAVVGSQASPWLAVHASAVRSLSTLSTRLRLGFAAFKLPYGSEWCGREDTARPRLCY